MDTIQNEIYLNFYYIVDNIIYEIHKNKNINKYLFNCKYVLLNNDDNIILPLTICLSGGGFILYNQIFKNEGLLDNIQLTS